MLETKITIGAPPVRTQQQTGFIEPEIQELLGRVIEAHGKGGYITVVLHADQLRKLTWAWHARDADILKDMYLHTKTTPGQSPKNFRQAIKAKTAWSRDIYIANVPLRSSHQSRAGTASRHGDAPTHSRNSPLRNALKAAVPWLDKFQTINPSVKAVLEMAKKALGE